MVEWKKWGGFESQNLPPRYHMAYGLVQSNYLIVIAWVLSRCTTGSATIAGIAYDKETPSDGWNVDKKGNKNLKMVLILPENDRNVERP